MHKKYGHVVRVNPDELSFTHPDSWKDVSGMDVLGYLRSWCASRSNTNDQDHDTQRDHMWLLTTA